jgi:RNA-binding protein YlmH
MSKFYYLLQADEVESDDEVEEDFKTEDGTKAAKVVVSSLRVDLVLKSCLGLARK